MPEIQLSLLWKGPAKPSDEDSKILAAPYRAIFTCKGSIEMISREQMMKEIEKTYKNQIASKTDANNRTLGYTINNLSVHGYTEMERRIDSIVKSIKGLEIKRYDLDRFELNLTYRKNDITGKYEIYN
jgi:hypothetical protein